MTTDSSFEPFYGFRAKFSVTEWSYNEDNKTFRVKLVVAPQGTDEYDYIEIVVDDYNESHHDFALRVTVLASQAYTEILKLREKKRVLTNLTFYAKL